MKEKLSETILKEAFLHKNGGPWASVGEAMGRSIGDRLDLHKLNIKIDDVFRDLCKGKDAAAKFDNLCREHTQLVERSFFPPEDITDQQRLDLAFRLKAVKCIIENIDYQMMWPTLLHLEYNLFGTKILDMLVESARAKSQGVEFDAVHANEEDCLLHEMSVLFNKLRKLGKKIQDSDLPTHSKCSLP